MSNYGETLLGVGAEQDGAERLSGGTKVVVKSGIPETGVWLSSTPNAGRGSPRAAAVPTRRAAKVTMDLTWRFNMTAPHSVQLRHE